MDTNYFYSSMIFKFELLFQLPCVVMNVMQTLKKSIYFWEGIL